MTAWNTTRSDDVPFELFFGYPEESEYAEIVERLVADRVASRIAAQDPTLWGPDAEPEASNRLSWVDLAAASRPLVAEIDALRAELAADGVDHVVLCGMGGSSLAPEVICQTADVDLTVLDSSSPDSVRAAISDRLDRTVVVVSSKSGSTLETDSQKRAYEAALRDAGVDPAGRIVVVTDPGSPLDKAAREAGYRVVNADPSVGGRYSALTAFGLVPSGLAGTDIGGLLDEAAAIAPALAADSPDNPALRLGGLLGMAALHGVDKVVLADTDSGLSGFADWAEQLIAESTGKQGRGILPVVVEDTDAANFVPSTSDEMLVTIGPRFVFDTVRAASAHGATVNAPLGAQMLLWEYATAVAGRIIGINPFDQPDVESAKAAARERLGGAGESSVPALVDGAVEVYASAGLLGPDVHTVAAAVNALLAELDPEHGYVAIMAYLDRVADAEVAGARRTLAERTGRPTTFGWAPRFLHSTGQYHKGGPATGVYLQITGVPREDLAVPDRDFTFGSFIAAQASGDAKVLAERNRPVVRLHLTDRDVGAAQLKDVLLSTLTL
ncbi:MAG TPA: glucose-6-phosphate isomerase [Nocardioidaceae bacterium]|nr:glucose-6-phosphate isomerase [Nocardioidaceae bacterium]